MTKVEFIVDGLWLGLFGLVAIGAGAAAAHHHLAEMLFCVVGLAAIAPIILRSMAADHYPQNREQGGKDERGCWLADPDATRRAID